MDFALLKELQHFIIENKPIQENIRQYSRIMLKIYDCSLNPKHMNQQFCLRIKFIAVKMICQIMQQYFRGVRIIIDPNLLVEASKIMILTGRLCLDQGLELIKQVQSFYNNCIKLCEHIFQEIPGRIKYLHSINCLQLMKYSIGNSFLSSKQFQRKILMIESLQQFKDNKSQKYVSYIILQVILKQLKQGNLDIIEQFSKYIPQQYADIINKLTSFSNINSNSQNLSQFYQIYLEIKSGGNNISQEYLRNFISLQKNINDTRLFDTVALTGNLLLLYLWFDIVNSRRLKTTLLKDAYHCFIYCVDKYLNENTPKFESYIELAKIILLSLLNDKKQSFQPIINIIKRIIRIVIEIIIRGGSHLDTVQDLCQKMLLVCSKHSIIQLHKIIYGLQLYYQIVNKNPREQIFNKFMKSNISDKSTQFVRILKAAYEIKKNNQIIDKQLISKKPYILILFETKINNNLILQLDMKQFIKITNPFYIYYQLLRRTTIVDNQFQKIIKHMQCFLQFINPKIINIDRQCINSISKIFYKLLIDNQQNNSQIDCSFVCLYVTLLQFYCQEYQNINYGISFNKYSIISKLLDSIYQLHPKIIKICQIILINTLKRYKQNSLKGITINQPGEIFFLQSIQRVIKQSNQLKKQSPNTSMFIKFTIFQIQCLTNTLDEVELGFEDNIDLLRLYCTSIHIPKQVKLKIIRKLVKQQLIGNKNPQITLNELKQLLLLSEDKNQQILYAEQIINLYPDTGKQYLLLLSQKYHWLEELFQQKSRNIEND